MKPKMKKNGFRAVQPGHTSFNFSGINLIGYDGKLKSPVLVVFRCYSRITAYFTRESSI
jgi:hypothetical protein